MAATALKLVSNNTPQPDYTYEKWVEDLRGIAWHALTKKGFTVEEMAAKAHLHPRTVEAFVWGETKFPRGKTLFELAGVLGFRNPWIPSSVPMQAYEAQVSSYHSLIKKR